MKERILTFLLVFLVWLMFSGQVTVGGVLIGGGVSVVTSFLFSDMLFRVSRVRHQAKTYPKKLFLACTLIPIFIYQALKAAIQVSRYAFKRHPAFNPGIVKVSTRLHSVTAITVLANLITLTPGTLTLDFDPGGRVYTIHWIDVKTDSPTQAKREIFEAFEKRLEDIFQ